MLGPWAFDLLSVPAQHVCGKPSVRLAGDFCGYPTSGFGAVIWVSGFSPYLLAGLALIVLPYGLIYLFLD